MDASYSYNRVERLGKYLEDYFLSFADPFHPVPSALKSLAAAAGSLAAVLEKMFGRELFVKARPESLQHTHPRFFKIIRALSEGRIVRAINIVRPIPDWPVLPTVAMHSTHHVIATGQGRNFEEATTKALGELFERNALVTYDSTSFTHGSWSALKGVGAVDPRIFSAFSSAQAHLPGNTKLRVDERSEFFWVRAVSLLRNTEHIIPAQLVYLHYDFSESEAMLQHATSNGAAAGNSREMALYNAACEAIERDALMLNWLNRLVPPRYDLEELEKIGNESINGIIALYRRFDIDVAVFDISTDIQVPTVLTMVRDRTPGRPAVYIAPRTDLDWESAIEGSLADGLRAGNWATVSDEELLSSRNASFPESLHERSVYWCNKDRLEDVNFMFQGKKAKIPGKNIFRESTFAVKLEELKRICVFKKLDGYVVDISTPEARAAGVWVIKIIFPALYPLYLNEKFKYLGVERLYQVPVRMGVFTSPKRENEMNTVPHPML